EFRVVRRAYFRNDSWRHLFLFLAILHPRHGGAKLALSSGRPAGNAVGNTLRRPFHYRHSWPDMDRPYHGRRLICARRPGLAPSRGERWRRAVMQPPWLDVVQFLRKPTPNFFSIERVFEDMRAAAPGDVRIRTWTCRHYATLLGSVLDVIG